MNVLWNQLFISTGSPQAQRGDLLWISMPPLSSFSWQLKEKLVLRGWSRSFTWLLAGLTVTLHCGLLERDSVPCTFPPAVLSTYCHTLTPKPDLGSARCLQLSLNQSGCRHSAPCKSDFHVSVLSQCIGRELWFLAPPGAGYWVSAAGGKFWVVVCFFFRLAVESFW